MNNERTEVCSNCGASAKVVTGDYRFTESGLPKVTLVGIDKVVCNECKNVDPIIPSMNDLFRILALAVAAKPTRLKGEEVRFLRKYLKMTAVEFSSHLGVDKTTISKWENNDDKPSARADRLIRAVAVGLSDDLREAINEIVQKFPSIGAAHKPAAYKIDPEAQTCLHA
jgi:putative zinc finger/helix-turn-helix YgiT family protein